VGDVFAHGGRRQADAVFVLLDFLGDADAHGSFLCLNDDGRTLRRPRFARNLAADLAQVPVLFAD
jgi:hypothetical protein